MKEKTETKTLLPPQPKQKTQNSKTVYEQTLAYVGMSTVVQLKRRKGSSLRMAIWGNSDIQVLSKRAHRNNGLRQGGRGNFQGKFPSFVQFYLRYQVQLPY